MYGEFIGSDLIEATREIFNLSDKREDTFIAGLSMVDMVPSGMD